jgi:hypothetical protein
MEEWKDKKDKIVNIMKINVKDILRDVKMFLKTIVSEYQSIIEVVIK